MGIGAQSKAPRGQSGPLASSTGSSSTAAYTAPEVKGKAPVIVRSVSIAEAALPNPSSTTGTPNDQGDALPPSYNEEEDYKPNVLLKPSDDNDLNYFHAIATGEPWMRPPSSNILVMNVFRTTQCHVYPIDERIAMGSSLAQPYYALKSAPSTTSVDEFNKLTISRRHPERARWTDAVISEISPRLNLLANGVMIIARINVLKPGNLIQKHDLTWEKARDSYTVWGNTGSGMKPVLEVRPDGWESLEDPTGDGGGVIRAQMRGVENFAAHQDLAVLDATKPSLQFISTSIAAQKIMDLLVGSMLTVAIVHTRMCKLGRANMNRKVGPQVINVKFQHTIYRP